MNILDICKSQLSNDEIRDLVTNELSDGDIKSDDPRLLLAADLLCDAAMEVSAQGADGIKMSKTVQLSGDLELPLSEIAIVHSLKSAHKMGIVSEKEMGTLLLRSSVANAISNALNGGATPDELAGSEVKLSPFSFPEYIAKAEKPKGILSRLLGAGG